MMNLSLLPTAALTLTLAAFVGPNAQAQIYRSIDAQGRVTFTDAPGAAAEAVARGNDRSSRTQPALPYELRQVQARYPVTLYTGPQCAPCDLGRNLLTTRGIPFAEKTVVSAEDVAALRQFSNSAELPVLAVGGKQIKGYEQTSWAQYLDAAGYPSSSQLPAGWKAAAPTPLAAPVPGAADPGTATAGAESDATTQPNVISPVRTADNPAGIRF